MKKFTLPILLTVVALSTVGYYQWQRSAGQTVNSSGPVEALNQASPGETEVAASPTKSKVVVAKRDALKLSNSPATNRPNFVMAPEGTVLYKSDPKLSFQDNALNFLSHSGSLFGIQDPSSELKVVKTQTDNLGMTHISYQQVYQGLDVFGADMKAHFNQDGNLTVVNGTFIPNVDVNTTPSISESQAMARAVQYVDKGSDVAPINSNLVVFRENLAKGVPGSNLLAYQVEVANGADVRMNVYVDAHAGKVIDAISLTPDANYRRVYDGQNNFLYLNYPNTPFWVEGNAFPSTGFCITNPGFPLCNLEADNLIQSSGDTYNFFFKTFGRDSFDGLGAKMDSIFDLVYPGCPNAFWDGSKFQTCPGLGTPDVVAHELGHAYTQYTGNMIYAFQPGALNESLSDIWGNTIEFLNQGSLGLPHGPRTEGSCSTLNGDRGGLTITQPASIAGIKYSGMAQFGAAPQPYPGVPAQIVATTPSDGCAAITENLTGKIALINRGGVCNSAVKVKNAQLKGAIGVVLVSTAASNLAPGDLAGVDATITIPTVQIGSTAGTQIRSALLSSPVYGAIAFYGPDADNSDRWLVGEDANAFKTITSWGHVGPSIRDMRNPQCLRNPTKVSDGLYFCFSGSDSGGVHRNSSVPNRLYALLTDGTNSESRGDKDHDEEEDDQDDKDRRDSARQEGVKAIGMLKAAHIIFRTQSTYLVQASDFANFADGLTASCRDLKGIKLTGFDGKRSKQKITKKDCMQVEKAIAAVELRTPPVQCNYQPLLAKNPPPLCSAGLSQNTVFNDSFEGSVVSWTISHSGQTPDFIQRDWTVVSALPDARVGKGFFASAPDAGTCAPGGDITAVLHLDSPLITIPAGATNLNLRFDHYIATEPGYDGGNVKVSVNGGPFQIVQAVDFVYNPYNTTLISTAGGNTNPLASQPAFSGTDDGKVTGSWGRSIVNLVPYGATPGSTVRLRFDLGNDCSFGLLGWYLDDVQVYQCKP